MHEHNCVVHDFSRDYHFCEDARPTEILPVERQATFQGYRRANGKAGTRNYLGVLTSVNCSATAARLIAREVERSGMLADYPHVDGVIALVHGAGCGMASKGEGFDMLARTQWGYAANPNMGGVLMVGLGCEVFQIGRMKDEHGLEGGRPLPEPDDPGQRRHAQGGRGGARAHQGDAADRRSRPTRDAAGERTDAGAAMRRLGRLFRHHRQSGAGRGGRHAGQRHGGTAILSETSEIYGAEHLLTRRAATPEIGRKLVGLIRWWEDYCARNGGEMNNNPSPGNKAGGLTTILEKSLGAAAKGGTTILNGVYRYAEPVDAKGFVFMDTPGYDPVSATGQVAGGANVIAFTTGRGSAYGCKPTPSIKLATNSDVYNRMSEDMDINCGDVLDGVSIAEKGQEIFDKVLAVASGEKSKSEALGYGDAEFVPWQIGATM